MATWESSKSSDIVFSRAMGYFNGDSQSKIIKLFNSKDTHKISTVPCFAGFPTWYEGNQTYELLLTFVMRPKNAEVLEEVFADINKKFKYIKTEMLKKRYLSLIKGSPYSLRYRDVSKRRATWVFTLIKIHVPESFRDKIAVRTFYYSLLIFGILFRLLSEKETFSTAANKYIKGKSGSLKLLCDLNNHIYKSRRSGHMIALGDIKEEDILAFESDKGIRGISTIESFPYPRQSDWIISLRKKKSV